MLALFAIAAEGTKHHLAIASTGATPGSRVRVAGSGSGSLDTALLPGAPGGREPSRCIDRSGQIARPSWLEVNKRPSKQKFKRDMVSFVVQYELVEGDAAENVENAVADAETQQR
jgi:hypothetical protein